jgi:predicted Zn-dependent protease with MMP-like domain
MYPLPRMLIAAALLVAVAYGIVAFFVLVPLREGELAYYAAVPLLVSAGLLVFTRGEPSDQTTVHAPRMSEAEFDELEEQVDRFARAQQSARSTHARRVPDAQVSDAAQHEEAFIELVREAIDELPAEYVHALEHVGVVVSDQGAVQRINGRLQPLYGLYIGYASRGSYVLGAPVSSALPDRIVIFRDTLVHDYGNDPSRLRREVARVLRHELAHHLGWDETGVRGLGL